MLDKWLMELMKPRIGDTAAPTPPSQPFNTPLARLARNADRGLSALPPPQAPAQEATAPDKEAEHLPTPAPAQEALPLPRKKRMAPEPGGRSAAPRQRRRL